MPAKGFEFSLMLSTNGACGKPVFSSASARHLQEFVARGAPSSRVRFDTSRIAAQSFRRNSAVQPTYKLCESGI